MIKEKANKQSSRFKIHSSPILMINDLTCNNQFTKFNILSSNTLISNFVDHLSPNPYHLNRISTQIH